MVPCWGEQLSGRVAKKRRAEELDSAEGAVENLQTQEGS